MSNLDLNSYGLQEMNAVDMKHVDGGEPPMGSYMTQEQLKAMGDQFGDFWTGFVNGFWSVFSA